MTASVPTPPSAPAVWSYLARYRGHIAIGIALLVATNTFALTIPYLLGRIVDALQGNNPAELIPPLALSMIAVATLQACARIGSRVALFNAARKAEYDLRSRLFRHLLSLDTAVLRTGSTGDVMSRLSNDVQTIRAMWGVGVLQFINTIFVFTLALYLMLRIDPWLTLCATLPYPSMFIFGRFFSGRLYKRSRAVTEQLGKLSAAVQEDLSGIGVIKSFALEATRKSHFRELSEELKSRNMSLVKIRGQLIPTLTGLASLSVVLVIFVGGRKVIDPSNPLTLGLLVQFNGYLVLLMWPTLALGWMLSLIQRGKASWQRLRDFFELVPAIRDGENRAIDASRLRGDLRVEHLDFEIDGRAILRDVSFEARAGSTVAIVGRTGAGKSTLVEMFPRLADPKPGTIFIDDIDITTMPLKVLRKAIGYAPQNAFLFSRSIAANIAYSSDDADVEAAATVAGLTRDLHALPGGLETVVGERGVTLSGGKRQRVALARALAANPRLLILDDSMSAVDANTEREILEHLRTAMEDRTAIIISHRIAAVRAADQILVFDDGQIVERGSHAELLASDGVYAELYRDQLTDELLAEQPASV